MSLLIQELLLFHRWLLLCLRLLHGGAGISGRDRGYAVFRGGGNRRPAGADCLFLRLPGPVRQYGGGLRGGIFLDFSSGDSGVEILEEESREQVTEQFYMSGTFEKLADVDLI